MENKYIQRPNFLVVGTAKSGTTSLFYYLNQHPDIHMPIKESHFFNNSTFSEKELERIPTKDKKEIVDNDIDYDHLYSFDKKPKEIIGEIGTGYLYDYPYSIPKIKKTLGDIPIIIILRNPIERAYSSYQHFVKLGRGDQSFEESLTLEDKRIEEGWNFMWHHKRMGFYSKQVEAFQKEFSKVYVTFFEDMKDSGEQYMKSLFEFIGVDPDVRVDTKKVHNQSKVPKSKLFGMLNSDKSSIKSLLRPIFRKVYSSEKRRSIKNKARNVLGNSYAEMNPKTRIQLINDYRADIAILEKLSCRDLKHWLKE